MLAQCAAAGCDSEEVGAGFGGEAAENMGRGGGLIVVAIPAIRGHDWIELIYTEFHIYLAVIEVFRTV